jgi:hypothetical protein
MGLFGSRTPPTIGELIARKRLTEAIEALRGRLLVEHGSTALRLQLADVLVMAGRHDEAVPILIRLADEFAGEGQVARALSVLKKVQRIAPGRADVEARLGSFLHDPDEPPPARGPAQRVEAQADTYEPYPMALAEEPQADVSDASAPPGESVLESDEEQAAAAHLRQELLDTIQQALSKPAPHRPHRKARTPLLGSLTEPELVALYRGLRLLTFDPGDLVLHQGDEGDRMFVIASGRCKVFMKEPGGRRRILVSVLGEGAFFGEMSLLRDEPRHETVVAASRCELLELEKPTLYVLCQTHPRVREVLEELSQQRLLDQGEALARRQRHGTAAPAQLDD